MTNMVFVRRLFIAYLANVENNTERLTEGMQKPILQIIAFWSTTNLSTLLDTTSTFIFFLALRTFNIS